MHRGGAPDFYVLPRPNAPATRPVRWASMKTEPQPSDREVLAGLVERVTYHNAENGFCVIRVRCEVTAISSRSLASLR
jgi:hypothetical protein